MPAGARVLERIRQYLLAKGLTEQELEPERRNG